VTTQITTRHPARTEHRTARSLPVVAGIGYSLAWIISVSVGAPNPAVAARGSQVVAAFAGHGGPAMAMFVLAEGVAAAALAVVMVSAARAARRCGARLAGLTGASFGIAAAVVSWIELALGAWLVYSPVAGRRTAAAGTAYQVLNRLDGAKMLLLAAMAVALSAVALTSRALPRWLAPLGFLLAASLVVSGLGYLLLAQGLASAVYVSGILLLAFVTSTGVTLAVAPGPRRYERPDAVRPCQAGRAATDASPGEAG
jgi:hypothetical protein